MNSAAVSPRSTLEALLSCTCVSQGWSLIALDLQKEVLRALWHIGLFSSILLEYHPILGHLASRGFSPELDLHSLNISPSAYPVSFKTKQIKIQAILTTSTAISLPQIIISYLIYHSNWSSYLGLWFPLVSSESSNQNDVLKILLRLSLLCSLPFKSFPTIESQSHCNGL